MTSRRAGRPVEGEVVQDSMIPLYHQVYLILRQQIVDGVYGADEPMPPEEELRAAFNVSRITIRRAFDRLVAEGYVRRRRGSGTFAQPMAAAASDDADLSGLLENLIAMGLKTQVELIEFDYVPAAADVAARLELPARATVQKAVRVRSHKGKPFSHLTTYVPEAIGRSYKDADLVRRPLLMLLEDAGVKIGEAEQVITARMADAVVAGRLGVEIGAALIRMRRLVRDVAGRPVEFIEALYRPDLYEFKMKLSRVPRRPGEPRVWAPMPVIGEDGP